MVQVPVLANVTVAEETPVVVFSDEVPAEHGPVALKLTCSMVGALFDSAVAVTVIVVGCVLPSATELGSGPRTMLCAIASTAGADGALCRGVEPVASGTSVVAIV